MADVHLVLREPVDLGFGPDTEHTFHNAGHLVDKQSGWLHVHDSGGTIASFPPHQVLGSVRVGASMTAGALP